MAKGKKAKKTASRALKPLSEALQQMIATTAACGFVVAGGFNATVRAVEAIIKAQATPTERNRALDAAGTGYRAAYVAMSLMDRFDAYRQRFDNYDESQLIEAGVEIIGKAWPTSTKPDRRTEAEHKACRAADVSWLRVREATGLKEKSASKKRKPRTGSNPPAPPPVDLVKASPKLADKAAANDYFGTAAAALLATVDKNAKVVDPRISSAVSDFLAAVKAALGIK